jgi:TniQ
MSKFSLPPRRPGPLPEIPPPEADEILSSWLSRSAALYKARPEALLEQVGLTESSPTVLDRYATPADLERLAVAMRSSSQAIQRMSFAGQPREALEFVAYSKPVWTCRQCGREFAGRGLVQVKLRQWFVAVASACRRCGGRLTPTRIYTARAIHEIIAAGEPYERHAFVCERLARAFDYGRPISAVTRAMKALAAPLPTNPRVFYRARKHGRLPDCPGRTPPLLWQLVGTKQLRRHAHSYRYWRPPTHRPYVAWPLVGQIAATVGLTVLEQAGMAMWDHLRALGLVEYGDQLIVREILAPD